MQLDLFAELRALQRHALVTLQERCRETDFADADAVLELQALLDAARSLLRDCVALEAAHLYPLIDDVGTPHFDLVHDRHYVQTQFLQLRGWLEGIAEHAQSDNPAWQVLVGSEGEKFSQLLHISVYAYLIHLECQHAATTAVSLTRGCGALPAAQRPLPSALATLKAAHHELLAEHLQHDAFAEAEERVIKTADLHDLRVTDSETAAAAA